MCYWQPPFEKQQISRIYWGSNTESWSQDFHLTSSLIVLYTGNFVAWMIFNIPYRTLRQTVFGKMFLFGLLRGKVD